jgi:hypothetical protein
MKIGTILFYGTLLFANHVGASLYLVMMGDLSSLDALNAVINYLPR